jgi:hypothetical protein
LDLAQGFSSSLDLAQGFLIVGFGPRLFRSFCTGHFVLVVLDKHFGWSFWTVILDGHFHGHFCWSFLFIENCTLTQILAQCSGDIINS